MLTDVIRVGLEQWDTAATVITVLITGLVTLVGFIVKMVKSDPVERKEKTAAARASDAEAHNKTVEGLYGLIDRLEKRLTATEDAATHAREEAAAAAGQARDAQNLAADVSQRYGELERAFDALWQWMNNVVSNWSIIRQQKDPPPMPAEVEHHHRVRR